MSDLMSEWVNKLTIEWVRERYLIAIEMPFEDDVSLLQKQSEAEEQKERTSVAEDLRQWQRFQLGSLGITHLKKWRNKWMNQWMNEQINGCTNERINILRNVLMYECTNEFWATVKMRTRPWAWFLSIWKSDSNEGSVLKQYNSIRDGRTGTLLSKSHLKGI